jgi:nicotinamide-nucleotide amidase
LLGLPSDLFDEHAPTSRHVAKALAEECRRRFASDYALATAAFPTFDPDASSPPLCHIALAAPDGTTTKPIPFAAHPDILKDRTAKDALNMLRLHLDAATGR